MLFRHSLQKKADIFTQTKNIHTHKAYYKPIRGVKKVGIIVSCTAILFILAVLLIPGQQLSKDAHAMIACPFQANGNVSDCNSWNNNWNGRGSGNWHGNGESGTDINGDDNNNWNNGNVAPINSTPFTPIQPQFQTISTNISPVQTIAPLNPNQLGGQNIGGISGQIIQVQQQIAGQMQGCINNAQQMANQIIGLENQQKQLQNQLDAENNLQQPNFDTSTTQGQQQQQQWQQQQQQKQQQLQSQIDNLSNAISNAQNNMNTANSNCQQNVSNLEQNRGQLESNLDDSFNNGMNIQIPNQ